MVYAPEDIDAEEILHRKLKYPNNNLTKYLAKSIKDAAENLFVPKKENDDSQLDAVHNIFLSAWQTISDHKNPNGKAENNFPAIAKEWTLTLKEYNVLKEDKEITPSMVTDLMIKLKMVRQATGIDLDDNYQDLIGYAGWGHALANFKKN